MIQNENKILSDKMSFDSSSLQVGCLIDIGKNNSRYSSSSLFGLDRLVHHFHMYMNTGAFRASIMRERERRSGHDSDLQRRSLVYKTGSAMDDGVLTPV